MNERVYEILYFLLTNENRVVPMDILCKKFEVSVRTIKNYLAIIEDYADNGMKGLFLVKGENVLFSGTAEQASTILNKALKEDFYEYKLSPRERRFIIGISLLLTDEPITLAQLNNLLFTSRATLIKDVADISDYFHDRNIKFYENKHKGFLLKLTESQRRDAILTLVRDEEIPVMELFDTRNFNICTKFLRQKINLDFYWKGAEAAVTLAEQHFNFSMADFEFYEIVLVLCISIARLSNSKFIEEAFSVKLDSNDMCIPIAENMLKSTCLLTPSMNKDTIYLAHKLKKHNLINSEGAANEKLINFYIIVKSFLYKLSLAYGLNLLNDYKLQEFLTAHVTGLYRRLQRGEKVKNPDSEQIIKKYKNDFRKLNETINVIEAYMGITLTNDEKCFVLIHIIAALERTRRKAVLPNVIIVCDSGIGTSVFLSEMVEKHFKVNIAGVLSFHGLKKELLNNPEAVKRSCDFILSTIPLNGITIPWLQVSVMLTLDELSKIHHLIIEAIDRKQLASEELPLENHLKDGTGAEQFTIDHEPNGKDETRENVSNDGFLWKQLSAGDILLDKQAVDWKEAIILAAGPLVRKQKCNENYVQCMVDNVIKNGPYIVFTPGIAIAHANPRDGASEFGVSFLRLSAPVKFGHKDNDPVDIIVALSLDHANKHKELLFSMMNVFCNKAASKELRTAGTYEQVIEILKKYERKSVYKKSKEEKDDL